MQNFVEIPSSRTLSDSLAEILNNDKTALSLSSGSAFPTTNLQLGMPCYRTDQLKLYILTQVSPSAVWKLWMDFSGSEGKAPNAEAVDGIDGSAVALRANNLSDLSNAATARSNLGLAAVAASGSAGDLASGTLPSGRLSGTYNINISGNAATASNGGVTSVNGLTGAVSVDQSGKANTNGSNASGTWPISISGNAATATSATTASSANSVAWSNVSSRPTALSAFTNDPGFTNGSGGHTSAHIHGDGVGAVVVHHGGVGGYSYWSPLTLIKSGNNYLLRANNCRCNCDCCCCFAPGTLVRMADKSVRAIEEIRLGDLLTGINGDVSVAFTLHSKLKQNRLFQVNDSLLVTGGHLFYANDSWAAVDPHAYPQGSFYRSRQHFSNAELSDVEHQYEQLELVHPLRIGDVVNGVPIRSISAVDCEPDQEVHNLIVYGGQGFELADGYLVDGFMRTTKCEGCQ